MGTPEAVKEVGSVNQSGDTASHSPRPTPIALAIYRDLRVGMVVIMVMLAAALVIDTISAKHPQSTLSAYYYTSAHCVFIAALLALSTLFFVYRGSSDTEDALLTLAGVCALVAALVPQGRPSPVGGAVRLSGVFADAFDDAAVRESFLPQDYNVEPVIERNVWAVVVALVLGWLLLWWQHRHNDTQAIRSAGGTLSLWLLRLIVLLGLIALVVPHFRPIFNHYAHGAAGFLMLFAFIATVIHAAYLAGQEDESNSPQRHRYQLIYCVIAGVMLVFLIAVVTLHFVRPNWWMGDLEIIVLESVLVLLFAAYWMVQTIELWDSPDRRERLPEAARNRLAQGRTTRGLNGLKCELFDPTKETRDERLLRLL